jgi:hypothetical protein
MPTSFSRTGFLTLIFRKPLSRGEGQCTGNVGQKSSFVFYEGPVRMPLAKVESPIKIRKNYQHMAPVVSAILAGR